MVITNSNRLMCYLKNRSPMKKTTLFIFMLIKSISVFAQVPATLKPADKIYGLSKFWEEVNYNFVYLDRINIQQWDSTYRKLIETIPETKNDYEYYRELQKFCAILKDGHTGVYLPDSLQSKLMTTMFGDYKLFMENLEGKAIITRVNFSKRNEIPPGSEVIEVNGLNTSSYIEKYVAPYISASATHVIQKVSIVRMFSGLAGESYKVIIRKPDGKKISLTLTHTKTEETAVYPDWDKHNGIFEFKWINKEIVYLGLYSFDNAAVVKQFIEKLPEISNAKGVILDIRNNGGGSSANAKNIIKYFMEGNLIYGERTYSRLHIPADKAIGSFLQPQDTVAGKKEWGLSKKETVDYYNASKGSRLHAYAYEPDTVELDRSKIIVPTVILTGNYTASAAEDFLIFADGQKHIKRIGEKTNGSTGQPYLIDLPGGGSAWICTKKATYKDGREFVGIGVLPDVEIKKTVKDFIKGKDPALEKAVEDIKSRM